MLKFKMEVSVIVIIADRKKKISEKYVRCKIKLQKVVNTLSM